MNIVNDFKHVHAKDYLHKFVMNWFDYYVACHENIENLKMNLDNISKLRIDKLTECPLACRNKIIKVALIILQSPHQDRYKALEKLSIDFNIPIESIAEFLSVILAIIRLFLSVNDKEFEMKLLDLGFSEDFIQSLPLINNRSEITDQISSISKSDYGKLVSLKWRIDISLSNSLLVKKIPASVILCIQLKNGQKYTINVDIRTFHKLRFNIALMIKELNQAKVNYPMLK